VIAHVNWTLPFTSIATSAKGCRWDAALCALHYLGNDALDDLGSNVRPGDHAGLEVGAQLRVYDRIALTGGFFELLAI